MRVGLRPHGHARGASPIRPAAVTAMRSWPSKAPLFPSLSSAMTWLPSHRSGPRSAPGLVVVPGPTCGGTQRAGGVAAGLLSSLHLVERFLYGRVDDRGPVNLRRSRRGCGCGFELASDVHRAPSDGARDVRRLASPAAFAASYTACERFMTWRSTPHRATSDTSPQAEGRGRIWQRPPPRDCEPRR